MQPDRARNRVLERAEYGNEAVTGPEFSTVPRGQACRLPLGVTVVAGRDDAGR